ncbi:MAG: ABC-2 family transporter protein [Clostridia bacterium]|nr:ABC-2 family transporter protein [Clostridia bacterium]
MKKYFTFFKIRFQSTLQYRTAAWAGVATQFVWGGMRILMFMAFYEADKSRFPMEFTELSSYIWLQQAFLALFAVWTFDSEIIESITSGSVANDLLRPMDVYTMWFTKDMASRMAKALLRCVPVIAITSFLPKPYGLSLPKSFEAFLLFLITLFLGVAVLVSMGMYIYILTMKFMSAMGVRILFTNIAEFLAGSIIPLPFMPDGIRFFLEMLPFASAGNLPLRIYSGNISGNEMWFYIAVQIFWLLFLQVTGRIWLKSKMKKVVVQGG